MAAEFDGDLDALGCVRGRSRGKSGKRIDASRGVLTLKKYDARHGLIGARIRIESPNIVYADSVSLLIPRFRRYSPDQLLNVRPHHLDLAAAGRLTHARLTWSPLQR